MEEEPVSEPTTTIRVKYKAKKFLVDLDRPLPKTHSELVEALRALFFTEAFEEEETRNGLEPQLSYRPRRGAKWIPLTEDDVLEHVFSVVSANAIGGAIKLFFKEPSTKTTTTTTTIAREKNKRARIDEEEISAPTQKEQKTKEESQQKATVTDSTATTTTTISSLKNCFNVKFEMKKFRSTTSLNEFCSALDVGIGFDLFKDRTDKVLVNKKEFHGQQNVGGLLNDFAEFFEVNLDSFADRNKRQSLFKLLDGKVLTLQVKLGGVEIVITDFLEKLATTKLIRPQEQTTTRSTLSDAGCVLQVPDQDDVISFSTKLLFIRQAYVDLFAKLKSYTQIPNFEMHGSILTGTPGLGKSLFIIYLLWRLVRESKEKNQTVNLVYKSENFFWMASVTNGIATNVYIPKEFKPGMITHFFPYVHSCPSSLWTIFDSEKPLNTLKFGSILLVTSPKEELWKEWQKQQKVPELFMPGWSDEEIDLCKELCYKDVSENLPDSVIDKEHDSYIPPPFGIPRPKKKIDFFGNCPRWLFAGDEAEVQVKVIERAIIASEVSMLSNLAIPGQIFSKDTSHKLLTLFGITSKFQPEEASVYIDFWSEHIRRVFLESVSKKQQREIENWLSVCDVSLLQVLRGKTFEAFLHMELPKGRLTLRPQLLEPKHRKQESAYTSGYTMPKEIKIPEMDVKVINPLEFHTIAFQEGIYYQPSHGQWETLDAVVRIGTVLYGIQMTVFPSHELKVDGMTAFIAAAKKKTKTIPATPKHTKPQIQILQPELQPCVLFLVVKNVWPTWKTNKAQRITKKTTSKTTTPEMESTENVPQIAATIVLSSTSSTS